MPILKKNITGFDIVSYLSYIEENEPIRQESIIQRFYPADASLDENSKETKLITDGIEFLQDIRLIEISETEITSVEQADFTELDTRLKILSALRTVDSEEGYDLVMSKIANEDKVLFDKNSQLKDWMNEYAPSETWSGNALQYWARCMDAIGVGRRLKDSGDSSINFGLFPDDDLVIQLLAQSIDGDSAQLRLVLDEIQKKYLPVLNAENAVTQYFQASLHDLHSRDIIELVHKDDGGNDVLIDGQSYNRISILN